MLSLVYTEVLECLPETGARRRSSIFVFHGAGRFEESYQMQLRTSNPFLAYVKLGRTFAQLKCFFGWRTQWEGARF